MPRRPTTSPWAHARLSEIHGQGLYATVAIPSGTRIIEYQGKRITKAEAKKQESNVYLFNLNKRHDIDGAAKWNTARYINHSCTPNCEPKVLRGRIWILARRDIEPGEELSFDYGYPASQWRDNPCRCGSPKCVGYIVAKGQRFILRRRLREERKRLRLEAKNAAQLAQAEG